MDTPNTPRRAATRPSCAAPLPTFQHADAQRRTPIEDDILAAAPLALARLLCGVGMLDHLRQAGNATRAHLAAAGRAMGTFGDDVGDETPADLPAARQALRAAVACAIRPDGIEFRPETILAQVALWLVEMQAEVEEVGALFAAAAAAASHGQPRH